MLHGRSKTYTVKEGRIRVTCERCGKKQYLVIPPGLRKKTVRCTCGLSAHLSLNHRASRREATCSKAVIILQDGKEYPIYLIDLSLGGVGFLIPPQYNRSIPTHQDLYIQFRPLASATVLRRIRITNRNNNRAGAQFLDNRTLSL